MLSWTRESTNSRGEDEYAAVLHHLTDWSAANRCRRVEISSRVNLMLMGISQKIKEVVPS